MVERINDGASMVADHIPEATILFADLVDFTPFSGNMAAVEVVGFLNRIFSAFDRLADRFGAEKIKTIGDAYMLAVGLPEPRDDHPEAAARMALAMIDALEALKAETKAPIRLRIGLHTGPAIAGVIGERKFAYDIWGATVNLASRMESHGAPDRIHISKALARRLEGKFNLTPRGPIDVKGAGLMETFFLDGERTITQPLVLLRLLLRSRERIEPAGFRLFAGSFAAFFLARFASASSFAFSAVRRSQNFSTASLTAAAISVLALRRGEFQFVVAIDHHAGFQKHCRHRGMAQNDQLVVAVDAGFRIDEIAPAAAHDRLGIMTGKLQVARLQLLAEKIAEQKARLALGIVERHEHRMSGEAVAVKVRLAVEFPGLLELLRNGIVMDREIKIRLAACWRCARARAILAASVRTSPAAPSCSNPSAVNFCSIACREIEIELDIPARRAR